MYFVKNVLHHGMIEMLNVHFVDVNYLLGKQIIVMDLRTVQSAYKSAVGESKSGSYIRIAH